MNLNSSFFTIFDTQLSTFFWKSKNSKAVIVLVHGMGEHALRYQESLIPVLLKNQYSVFAYDNFGHGKTKGKRGHCPSYEALQLGVDNAVSKAKELNPNVPIFLYGHSMGGNLVLKYAIGGTPNLKGVIATSPLLELAFKPPKWKTVLGKLMLYIWPSITLPSGLDSKAISRDENEVKRYNDDPLVHDKISPVFSFPVFEAGDFLINHAKWMQVPTLVIHGSGDRLTSHEASRLFSSRSQNITFELLDGGYHELHHDLCHEQFFEIVVNWLKAQM